MSEVLVFDTGPLSIFAEAGWLKILQVIVRDREVVVPELVRDELKTNVAAYPFLRQVLDADWVKVDRGDEGVFGSILAEYESDWHVDGRTSASAVSSRSPRREMPRPLSTTTSHVMWAKSEAYVSAVRSRSYVRASIWRS